MRVFLVFLSLLILILIVFPGCQGQPKELPLISPERAENYVGQKIKTIVTPIKEIKDISKFAYYIFIPSWAGKTMILIPIPVFKKYRVFQTKEGLHLAFKKGADLPELGKKILVTGEIKKHKKHILLFVQEFKLYSK